MFDVFFIYNSDDNRTCKAILISNDSIYASSSQINLNGGKNQSKAITLTNTNTTPVGTDYILLIQFFDINNNSSAYNFSQNVQVKQGKQGFYSSNGKIYDGNKNEFIMRGINNGHIWADGWNKWWSYNSLPQIKQTGANSVRIAWASNSSRYALKTPSDLDKILNSTIANKMVPIFTVGWSNCGVSFACLLSEVDWIITQMSLLIKYRQYILVNFANEWQGDPPSNYSLWRYNIREVISRFRNAGFSGELVVDSSNNQDPTSVLLYGAELVAFDPAHNLIMSIHMYSKWANDFKNNFDIAVVLQNISRQGIPFIVGEFGKDQFWVWNSKCLHFHLDTLKIMSQCQILGFGYLAWEWGYSGALKPITTEPACALFSNLTLSMASSLTNDPRLVQLSYWGDLVVNSPDGIKVTSKEATIFKA
jgi:mannan endo-1,4-beta-mannosidase